MKALNGKIAELSKARDWALKEVAELKLTLQVTTEARDELRTNLAATQAKLLDTDEQREGFQRELADEAHTERGEPRARRRLEERRGAQAAPARQRERSH